MSEQSNPTEGPIDPGRRNFLLGGLIAGGTLATGGNLLRSTFTEQPHETIQVSSSIEIPNLGSEDLGIYLRDFAFKNESPTQEVITIGDREFHFFVEEGLTSISIHSSVIDLMASYVNKYKSEVPNESKGPDFGKTIIVFTSADKMNLLSGFSDSADLVLGGITTHIGRFEDRNTQEQYEEYRQNGSNFSLINIDQSRSLSANTVEEASFINQGAVLGTLFNEVLNAINHHFFYEDLNLRIHNHPGLSEIFESELRGHVVKEFCLYLWENYLITGGFIPADTFPLFRDEIATNTRIHDIYINRVYEAVYNSSNVTMEDIWSTEGLNENFYYMDQDLARITFDGLRKILNQTNGKPFGDSIK